MQDNFEMPDLPDLAGRPLVTTHRELMKAVEMAIVERTGKNAPSIVLSGIEAKDIAFAVLIKLLDG